MPTRLDYANLHNVEFGGCITATGVVYFLNRSQHTDRDKPPRSFRYIGNHYGVAGLHNAQPWLWLLMTECSENAIETVCHAIRPTYHGPTEPSFAWSCFATSSSSHDVTMV